MANWFTILVGDLIAGLITWGFLEALIEIDPIWGRSIAILFTITDYAIYLWKGYNLIKPIIEWLDK